MKINHLPESIRCRRVVAQNGQQENAHAYHRRGKQKERTSDTQPTEMESAWLLEVAALAHLSTRSSRRKAGAMMRRERTMIAAIVNFDTAD
jgi:hypothetical protein